MMSVSFKPCLFLWRDKICLSLLDELESLKRLGTIQCSSSYFVSEMIKTIRETRFYIVGNRFLFVFLCVRVLMCVSILSLKNILLILESLHTCTVVYLQELLIIVTSYSSTTTVTNQHHWS